MKYFVPRVSAAFRLAAVLAFALLAFAGVPAQAHNPHDGVQFVSSLPINRPGFTGTVTTNPDNCTISATITGPVGTRITLVTYRLTEPSCAPITQATQALLNSQMLVDYQTLTIPAGGQLTLGPVRLPACAGQWDLVRGSVIEQFLGSDAYNFYNPVFGEGRGQNRTLSGAFTYECRLLAFDGCVTQEMLRACQPTICTFTRGGYAQEANGNNVGAFLAANFAEAFPQGVIIGLGAPNAATSVTLKTPAQIRAFLRSHNGTPGTLLSPNNGGTYAAQVLTLQLNVAFNAAYGGLVLCNTGGSLEGVNVAQILVIANRVLGGGALPAGYSISNLNDLVTKLNEAFHNCNPSDFAKRNLCEPNGEALHH